MDRSELAIVIPAYNEEDTIAAVVQGVTAFASAIVVDDASTDATGARAARSGAVVVRHAVNRGYDAALNSGFARAAELGCKYIVTMDADGQHDPVVISDIHERFKRGAALVIGVRDKRQRFAEHVFAWVAKMMYGIRDPLCGLKGYRIDVYRHLGHFDSYGSIGTELALFGVRNGYVCEQVPVKTRERQGAPRFGRRFRANYLILRALLLSFFRIPRGRAVIQR